MKNFKYASAALFVATALLLFFINGCTKQGPVGPAGNNGKDGNANIKVYVFKGDSLTGAHSFYNYIPLRQGIIDSSLILSYYYPRNGYWYPAPGSGASSMYITRTALYPTADSTAYYILAQNNDGSTYTGSTIPLDTVRIIVAPAMGFGKKDPVDFNDYHATMVYFGLIK